MPELHSIPLIYPEGVYSVVDFSGDVDSDNAIFFDYDAQYQMLTYDIRDVLSSVFLNFYNRKLLI